MKFLSMKRILLAVVAILMIIPSYAGDNDKIKWMTWDEAQVAMKKKPKKVWVDVYTDWCGWCKVMDKKTFSNPDVIKYMNENFYAVKFDAETKEDIRFMGNVYKLNPSVGRSGTNELAIQLLSGQLSYPSMIYMEENFQNPVIVPGYQPAPQLQTIFNYLMKGAYKQKIPLDEFSKGYTPTWKEKS
ncbi:MAG: DUF255 domain-containing protein [Flavipsychrobacter sp.]